MGLEMKVTDVMMGTETRTCMESGDRDVYEHGDMGRKRRGDKHKERTYHTTSLQLPTDTHHAVGRRPWICGGIPPA